MTDNKDHGENCTCGCQDISEEDMRITLEFDDGEDVVTEPLFVFDLDGKEYMALIPIDEESEDVYLYAYHELENDEFELLDIEDDDEFDKVAAEFDRIMAETVDTEE